MGDQPVASPLLISTFCSLSLYGLGLLDCIDSELFRVL